MGDETLTLASKQRTRPSLVETIGLISTRVQSYLMKKSYNFLISSLALAHKSVLGKPRPKEDDKV